jgi:1-deoxyxylulose-5-phosphate synthase
MDTVALGSTGLRVSRLAFGTGTNGWGGSSNQSRTLGLKGLADLLRYAHDLGVRFWDTADQYGTHPHVAEALKGLDRESVVITTKTTTRTGDGVTKDLDRFRKEMGTDYVDIVMLHGLGQADWPQRFPEAMAALTAAREKGLIRAVGVSCHDLGALRTSAETDWVQVALVRLNHAGKNMDGTPEEVLPLVGKMRAAGKGTYGMKVVAAGELVGDVPGAIRWMIERSGVDAMVMGMTSREEVRRNVDLIERFDGVTATP